MGTPAMMRRGWLATISTFSLLLGFLVVPSAATAAVIDSVCDAVEGNLVVNCGFESGDLTGWQQSLDATMASVSDVTPHSGGRHLAAGNPTPGAITQTVATVPGTVYWVGFFLVGGDPAGGGAFSLEVDPDGAGPEPVRTLVTIRNAWTDSYEELGSLFQATGSTTTITFRSISLAGSWLVDDVVVAPALKDGCKAGDWNAFAFDNQGLCVSYVQTGMDTRSFTPDTTPPSVPQALSAIPGDSQVELRWDPVMDLDVAGFVIRQADGSPDGVWSQVGDGTVMTTGLAVTGLANGTEYWFTVSAVDSSGNVSEPSAPISVVPMPALQVMVQRGSVVSVPLPDGVETLEDVAALQAVEGVSWSVSPDGGLAVLAEMSASEGQYVQGLSGTGCDTTGCDLPWSLGVALTISGIEAPGDIVVDGFPVPSPDRVAAATVLSAGLSVMGDEVTIVLTDPAGGRATADDVAGTLGAVVAGGFEDLGIFLLRWGVQQDVQVRLDQLIADVRVASVEGNFLSEVAGSANIEGYSDEGKYRDGEGDTWHLDLINAPDAWKKATGEGVKIGILELGKVTEHEDLPPVTWVGGVGNGDADDNDHANHVAGLACAEDNAKGVIGVAPECDLLAASIGEYVDRPGGTFYEQNSLASLKRLMDSGARVINASFGKVFDCAPIEMTSKGVHYEACDVEDLRSYYSAYEQVATIWARGDTNSFATTITSAPNTLLVVSAGNDGLPTVTNQWGTYAYEYDVPNVLTVASVDENAKLSYFSNFADQVDIAAPGGFKVDGDTARYQEKILSTISGNIYGRMPGTSMAAPIVSGTAALVAELHPKWTGEQIATCLVESSTQDVTARNDGTPTFPWWDGNQYDYRGSIPLLAAAAAVSCEDIEPEPTVTDISNGMALMSDSSVWAWGSNSEGAVGDGTAERRLSPVRVLSNVDRLGNTSSNTRLVIDKNDTLWGWGNNWYGQLGDVATTGSQLFPVKILENVEDVEQNISSTFAIRSDGTLWAWGNNVRGGVGNGTTTPQTSPVQILDNVASVTTAAYSGYAVKTDGTLWAWGENERGQLGDGTTINRLSPVRVLDNVTSMADRPNETAYAIRGDGTLWSWGANAECEYCEHGLIGDGTRTDRLTPVQILNDVKLVAAGLQNGYAVKNDGTLWVWGGNRYGQLGLGAPVVDPETGFAVTTQESLIPIRVLDNVLTIYPRGQAPLAIRTDHTLWAWGNNSSWQLGNGTTSSIPDPTKILDHVAAISGNHALRTDGTLWGWGRNYNGEVGDGTTIDRSRPVPVRFYPVP